MGKEFCLDYRIKDLSAVSLFRSLIEDINRTADRLNFERITLDETTMTIRYEFKPLVTEGIGCFVAMSREGKNHTFSKQLYGLARLCQLDDTDYFITLNDGHQIRCQLQDKITSEKEDYSNDDWKLFDDKAHLLLKYSEEIKRDSKMFLSPIYTHKSSFFSGYPTLGVFIEWWEYCKENGIEKNGYPVCEIVGNPMTGSHGCKAMTPEGEMVKAELSCSFIDLLKSFGKINSRYRYLPEFCQTYTLTEIIERFRQSEENQKRIKEVVNAYREDFANLYFAYKDLRSLQLIQRENRVFYSDAEQVHYDRELCNRLQRNYEDLFDIHITRKNPELEFLKKVIHPYYLAQLLGESW